MKYTLILWLILPFFSGLAQEKTDILKDSFGFTEDTPHSVPLEKLIPGCPKPDCIPSIDKPVFIAADQANFLLDDDRVLALVYNGIEKAYPTNILAYHEVVNDLFDEAAVLVSFCPLCGSGVAYKREVNGKPVEFGVSGVLYNSDLVMYDRETRSLWDQIGGKAIVGESTGQMLEMISVAHTTWKEWRAKHPKTLVLSTQTGMSRDYTRNPYLAYEQSPNIQFPVEHQSASLRPKTWVYGLLIEGKAMAFKADWLQNKKSVKVKLAKRKLTVTYGEDGSVHAVDKKTGETFATKKMFWFAWAAFQPKTKIKGGGQGGFLKAGVSKEQKYRRDRTHR